MRFNSIIILNSFESNYSGSVGNVLFLLNCKVVCSVLEYILSLFKFFRMPDFMFSPTRNNDNNCTSFVGNSNSYNFLPSKLFFANNDSYSRNIASRNVVSSLMKVDNYLQYIVLNFPFKIKLPPLLENSCRCKRGY